MAEVLPAYTGQECDWYNAPCHITSAIDWLYGFVIWVPMKIFEKLSEGLASMIAGIPVPEFVNTATVGLQGIPPGVAFFLDHAQIPEGIAMIMSAYVLRFAIRRLPFVG